MKCLMSIPAMILLAAVLCAPVIYEAQSSLADAVPYATALASSTTDTGEPPHATRDQPMKGNDIGDQRVSGNKMVAAR